ncbi:MAG: hypothetical protein HPM95_06775 [Alphaproteobacteria bacterium]|nr:hypothetical protein [Alphaproteobacteria bacterium]
MIIDPNSSHILDGSIRIQPVEKVDIAIAEGRSQIKFALNLRLVRGFQVLEKDKANPSSGSDARQTRDGAKKVASGRRRIHAANRKLALAA